MRKRITLYATIFIAGALQSFGQTLDESIKIAAENNPGLKASYTQFEAAMQRVAQVYSLPNPTISLGAFISPIETRVGPQQAKLGLAQMFPWFGTLQAKENMATAQAEAQYQRFINAQNELTFKVKEAWYPLYELHQAVVLQKQNLEILASFKQLSLSSFKNGKGSMSDVIRVDLMMEAAETDLKILSNKELPLLSQLNALLNRPESSFIALPDFIQIVAVDDLYRRDSLVNNHPMIKMYGLQIKSAQAQEELAFKMGQPNVGVGIDYIMVGKRTDVNMPKNGKDALMPMVTVSVPIYRKRYAAAVQEAQLNQAAIAFQQQDFENTLQASYSMTWFQLSKASELSQLYANQVVKTKQVITLLLSSYSNSGADFKEILRMQQQLLKYQLAEAVAVKEYYTALARLDYITAKSE